MAASLTIMDVNDMGTKMTNHNGAADCSVRARFEDLRRTLHECQGRHLEGRTMQAEQRWDKPLGYWAWAGDRRLPYALLDRSVREVMQASFAELSETPGIGRKKMASLVMLLERAVHGELGPARSALAIPALATPALATTALDPSGVALAPGGQAILEPSTPPHDSFRFEAVSESHWELWRRIIREHRLSQAPLGQFAPSLQGLPSVIWHLPLATYTEMSLAEMRRLKAHGEKRIRGVVEVFYYLQRALPPMAPARHLACLLRPAFVVGIEQWVLEMLGSHQLPELQEVRHHLVLPLLNQIELDGGETVGQLVAGRLGVESAPESVVEQAERMKVTRARVYQLLESCAEIMAVRWPEGRWQLAAVAHRMSSLDDCDPRREAVRTLEALLFPPKSRPMKQATKPTAARSVDAGQLEPAER